MALRLHTPPPTRLTEAVPLGGAEPLAVDKDRGVIRHVKVCGLASQNGRRYPLDVLRKAARLYEGRPVNLNHLGRPADQRDADDGLGRLVNVVCEADGLYADLEYLKAHPFSARLVEAAERMPTAYGLSHDAAVKSHRDQGAEVIDEITEVFSVDLVREPATTKGLHESRHMKRVKVRSVLEGLLPRFDQGKRERLKRYLEGDGCGVREMDEMEEPAAEMSPEDALKSGFGASGNAIIDAALSGEMDPAEAIKKLKDLLTAHGKLTDAGGGEEPEEAEEAEGDDEETDDEDKPAAESKRRAKGKPSVQEENRRLTRELAARRLCERHKVTLSPTQMRALEGLGKDDAEAFVREHKAALNAAAAQKPRSGAAGGTARTTEAKVPDDYKAYRGSVVED